MFVLKNRNDAELSEVNFHVSAIQNSYSKYTVPQLKHQHQPASLQGQ